MRIETKRGWSWDCGVLGIYCLCENSSKKKKVKWKGREAKQGWSRDVCLPGRVRERVATENRRVTWRAQQGAEEEAEKGRITLSVLYGGKRGKKETGWKGAKRDFAGSGDMELQNQSEPNTMSCKSFPEYSGTWPTRLGNTVTSKNQSEIPVGLINTQSDGEKEITNHSAKLIWSLLQNQPGVRV